jgi:hypothetical protein
MKLENIVPIDPPALRVMAVIKHLQESKQALVALQLEVPSLLLAVAEESPGAKEDLATLREKIVQVEFWIAHSAGARQLAERHDATALVAWKAEIQKLPLEQIIDGISKESCCRRCRSGAGCVITGSDILAGPCAHPALVGTLELQRYVDNPRIQEIYSAACAKLGLRSRAA